MLAVFRFQRDSKVKIDLVGRVAENFTRLRRARADEYAQRVDEPLDRGMGNGRG